MKRKILAMTMAVVLICCCSVHKKITSLKKTASYSLLSLSERTSVPTFERRGESADTLKVSDDKGKEILIMRAVKEEDGEMVATDVVPPAVVTARFRNLAERKGEVDLCFNVTVPKAMLDSKWQLRLRPSLLIQEDEIKLEPLIISGSQYRKLQMRGYERYEKFLASIVSDSTKFLDKYQLEIFLKRNLPQIYRYKKDSAFVSEQVFASSYGITEQAAIRHYTNKNIVSKNKRRISRKDKMKNKFIKSPFITEKLRLDTVLTNNEGGFVYRYVQKLTARPGLRKAEIMLSGAVFEQEKKVYSIPQSEALTFYISSLSSLVDNVEKYLAKIVERKAQVNTACYIDFGAAGYRIDPAIGNNKEEIERIKDNLRELVKNEEFELDSIIITASCSPEGNYSYNHRLSALRSESVSAYFKDFIGRYADSLKKQKGLVFDLAGAYRENGRNDKIRFISRSEAENWEMLKKIVEKDTIIDEKGRKSFLIASSSPDPDKREKELQKEPYYNYLRTTLYPRLRTVRFDIHLHRRGMVKDTVHTTSIDTTYMKGVQAIRDRRYNEAILILQPYKDFNTAVAYCAMDYNHSAMSILQNLDRSDKVEYLMALIHSRNGDDSKAVECYLRACGKNRDYISRGNLDPEISSLIKKYSLNKEL